MLGLPEVEAVVAVVVGTAPLMTLPGPRPRNFTANPSAFSPTVPKSKLPYESQLSSKLFDGLIAAGDN